MLYNNSLRICFIAVILVFSGYIAFDMQQLLNIYYSMQDNNAMLEKISIMGALHLFIAFVNIFVSLLHLLGNRRK